MTDKSSVLLTSPGQLKGEVVLPSSKSICNRALLINAMCPVQAEIENLSDCDDTRVLQRALSTMSSKVDVGAAGTAMRFLTAYLAIADGEFLLTGTERMKQRPIAVLVEALRSLGADIAYVEHEGFPPLRIKGKQLRGGVLEVVGNVSSQYISALLMIAPLLESGLTVQLTGGVISRPYIDLTLQLMSVYGARASWQGATCIRVEPGGYRAVPYRVESDWSAASYWYAMVALGEADTLFLPGLYRDSLQGDRQTAVLFDELGVQTIYHADGVYLRKQAVNCQRLEYDFVEQPDLVQTFVVVCCMLGIPFCFGGLQSLRIKETDRISALKNEVHKLGFVLNATNEELSWDGERCSRSSEIGINTYEDHRMAMAFAPAVFRLGKIRIHHPQVVTKSYPEFWQQIGRFVDLSFSPAE